MQPAYQACTDERGTGSYARVRSIAANTRLRRTLSSTLIVSSRIFIFSQGTGHSIVQQLVARFWDLLEQ